MRFFQRMPLLMVLVICISSCANENGETDQVDIQPTVCSLKIEPLPIKKVNNEFENFKAQFDTDYIMGKFNPAKHSDFIKIPIKYADREGLFLRKDAFESFVKMQESAVKAGIKLQIRSATRNFNSQKNIWEGKWKGTRKIENGKNASKAYPNPVERARKILEYSSMPGTSRHHWGTDIDLNNFTNEYFEKGQGLKEYEWLLANASKFGYCQVYSPKDDLRPNGYNEEKWHWSFLPIAKNLTRMAKEELTNQAIKGFEGAATAVEIEVVENYILGINPDCL